MAWQAWEQALHTACFQIVLVLCLGCRRDFPAGVAGKDREWGGVGGTWLKALYENFLFSMLGIFLTNKPFAFLVQAKASPLSPAVSAVVLSKAEWDGGNAGSGSGSSGELWTALLWRIQLTGMCFYSNIHGKPFWWCGHMSSLSPSLSIYFPGVWSSYLRQKAIWWQGLLWALGIGAQKLSW